MALQSSGAISLNEIHIEAGGSSGTLSTINDSDIRGLIGKSSGATMSFSEWYGASSAFTTSCTPGSGYGYLGFREQGSQSHTYSRSVSPSSDVGSLGAQGGWIPNSNSFTVGSVSTSAGLRAYFRDSTLSTSSERTSQAPHYSYSWPMGTVTLASDSNFTQDVITISSSSWTSQVSAAMQYTSWISGVGWAYGPSTNAGRQDLYDLFGSTVYVKIET
jgi:hypothetical protein